MRRWAAVILDQRTATGRSARLNGTMRARERAVLRLFVWVAAIGPRDATVEVADAAERPESPRARLSRQRSVPIAARIPRPRACCPPAGYPARGGSPPGSGRRSPRGAP